MFSLSVGGGLDTWDAKELLSSIAAHVPSAAASSYICTAVSLSFTQVRERKGAEVDFDLWQKSGFTVERRTRHLRAAPATC